MLVIDCHEAASRLSIAFAAAARAVAFTGAGISTESGVPDYRSANSPWLRNKPIPYKDFLSDPEQRAEAWRRKFAMDDLYAGARPTRGHHVLSRLVADGCLSTIITQNIDNLHHESGISSDRIVELHGNGTYALCLDCGRRHELAPVRVGFERSGIAPRCESCAGIVKSATISFGQSLKPETLKAAGDATLACDLFVVIGSSLVVYPAAALPIAACRNGAQLIILNREPTPLDAHADWVLRGDIGDILSRMPSLVSEPGKMRSLDHTS